MLFAKFSFPYLKRITSKDFLIRTRDEHFSSCGSNNAESTDNNSTEEEYRNVSRLPRQLQLRNQNKFPGFTSPKDIDNYAPDCELWARYGSSATGLTADICWPTVDEIEDMIAIENEYDLTLEAKLNIIENRKREKTKRIMDRQKEIEENMKKLPLALAEFEKKQRIKEEEQTLLDSEKEDLIQQAREYYGFAIDPRDERMSLMLDELKQKQEAEKKRRKKEERTKRAALKLKEMISKIEDQMVETEN